ncbi:cyclic nucleotide-binding domain-containing protein [Beijerinckia indica]|nr:mechanosensitive ion channel family protein [Beijerinckia indica]
MTDYPSLLAVLTDPIIQTGSLAVFGALITQGILRNHPSMRLIGQITLFVALTTLLIYHGIVPYEPGPPQASLLQSIFFGLAKVVWWINVALSLISFVRVFLIFEKQPREIRLLQDIVVGLIYVGVALSIVTNVFGFPVGTLIATSGVVAIILGLALQNTLSDLFSGVALNLGQPYGIGDWIVVSDVIEGRVVETNWRATHLLNGANDLVILPNSNLAKANLINMSSPDRSHGVKFSVRLAPTRPAFIIEVMRDVLLSSTKILRTPAPTLLIKSLDAQAIEIEFSFRVMDLGGVGAAKNELFDLIYRHAKAAGLSLAPYDGSEPSSATSTTGDMKQPGNYYGPSRLLAALPLFASLTEEEREALAETVSSRTYHKDEIVVEQGVVQNSLVIVRRGALVVNRMEEDRKIELGRLAPGDCFGEASLLAGTGSPGTVQALTFVMVYEIAKEALMPLMQDRPAIAEELGLILSRRVQNEQHLFGGTKDAVGIASASGLVARIRQIFQLS